MRLKLVLGCFAALVPGAALQARVEPPEPSHSGALRLALIDLRPDETSQPWGDRPCPNPEGQALSCEELRSSVWIDGTPLHYFGEAPDLVGDRFVEAASFEPRARKGRYLAIVQESKTAADRLVWRGLADGGRWCIPADIVGTFRDRLVFPSAHQQRDGKWCVSRAAAEREIAVGQARANQSTPYSFIVGQIRTGRSLDLCYDEDCWTVLYEARLKNVSTLAGQDLQNPVTVRFWTHATYVRGAWLGAPYRRDKEGRWITPGRPYHLQDGAWCIDQGYFYPAREGMAVPPGGWHDDDGNVCFKGDPAHELPG